MVDPETRLDNRHTSVNVTAANPVSRTHGASVNLVSSYLGTAVGMIRGFLLVPLYLRSFDLGVYGAWLASGNLLGLLGVLDGGFTTVFSQELSFVQGRRDLQRFAVVCGSGLLALTLVSVTIATGGWFLADVIAGWVDGGAVGGTLVLAIQLAGVAAGASVAQNALLAIGYSWHRTVPIAFIRLGVQITEIAVICVGLFIGWGVASLGAGALMGSVAGLLAAGVLVASHWYRSDIPRIRSEWHVGRSMLQRSLPFYVSKAFGLVFGNTQAAVVAVLITPQAAAILSLTDRLFQLAQTLSSPIGGAVFYGLAGLHGEGDTRRLAAVLETVFRVSTALSAVTLSVALAMNSGFVMLWVGSAKYGGLWLSTALCISAVLSVRANLVGAVLPSLGEIKRPAYCGIVEQLVRFPAGVGLVQVIGIVGMPLSQIVGFVTTTLWYNARVLNQRLGLAARQGLDLQFGGGLGLGTAIIAGWIAAVLLPKPANWWAFSGQFVICGLVAFLLVVVADRKMRSLIRLQFTSLPWPRRGRA